MNKAVTLPLVAAISGALLGCGGSGSSGPSEPAPTKYTFSFIQMEINKDPELVSSTCMNPTYFKEYETGYVDYAKIASTVERVVIHDENGEFFKDLSSNVNSAGTLTFTEDDIPDSGYIVVIDNVGSASNKNVHSLAIQKELLGDYLIALESPQGGSAACYSSGKLTVADTAKAASLASADGNITISQYGVETLRNGKTTSSAAIKREVDVTDNTESVLFSGYDNEGMINSYSLVKASTLFNDVEGQIPNPVELDTLSDFAYVNWSSDPAKMIDASEILAFSTDTAFSWQALQQTVDEVNITDELEYALRNQGNYNGWEVTSNTPTTGNSFDNELTGAYVDLGIEPSIACVVDRCSVENNGAVRTSDSAFSRSYIEVGDNSKHTIYAIADDSGSIVIPDYYDIDDQYKPSDSDSVEMSVITTSGNVDSDFVKLMMVEYHAPLSSAAFVDKVSIVPTPNEMQSNKLNQAKLAYEIIQK